MGDRGQDPRVSAVLEVLAGTPAEVVARTWAVDPGLLDRWVRAFVEAGAAQVTNRPSPQVARQRDRFLTTFMHGLRSPLAVAQMWVGLLGDAPGDGQAVLDIVAQLQSALDQLDERATDVQLLTAAMLGRLSLETRRVHVEEVATVLQPPPATIGGEGMDVEVSVDPELFGRILRDLWEAAHEAGATPGEVRLEVETVQPWVEIRVVRVGAPIEPAELHAMFEPFDREEDDIRTTVGLYLARALVVVHGGTIGVDQDDDTTVFAVRVPDARLSAAPDPD
ncbi:sensor histidine kinase [Nocardioides litoris]|uniref:sensor histidine kinase n=1 Tax=Nocardioides litoris TaxID=1926648 RepID=UPI001124C71E|nr:HAMP domain-containing sensor histidine kinase [Nocardioides litoris]